MPINGESLIILYGLKSFEILKQKVQGKGSKVN